MMMGRRWRERICSLSARAPLLKKRSLCVIIATQPHSSHDLTCVVALDPAVRRHQREAGAPAVKRGDQLRRHSVSAARAPSFSCVRIKRGAREPLFDAR